MTDFPRLRHFPFQNFGRMERYSRAIPALDPILSDALESAVVPAMAQGYPINIDNYIAAKRQMKWRDTMASEHPGQVTNNELSEAERRFDLIKSMHHCDLGPDGQPIPHWAENMKQQMVDVMVAGFAQQKHAIRVVQQGTQRALNRAIKTRQQALEPVIRLSDGTLPANFPATLEELERADEGRIDELLLFYGLDPTGTLFEKRHRLEWFLGYNS